MVYYALGNMISPQTLSDLNKAFEVSPKGFVITDSGTPRFAVVDFATFEKLRTQKKSANPIRKILITGGAGYIGSHAVKVLRQKGYEVVVYDNLSTGRREAVGDAKLIVGDLADREFLAKVFTEEKIDAVMHFAASIEAEESVYKPVEYFQNNVINGLNLLDVMVAYGVSKLVFSSSAAVYGDPTKLPIAEDAACAPANPYGESKLVFEKILKWYAKAYGLHSISLRYFNAAGAWAEEGLGYRREDMSHLIPRVLDVAAGKTNEISVFGQDYGTPDGTCIRDYIHVLDLAEAHIAALEKLAASNGAYVYNVGTGRGYSVLEVIDAIMEITGYMILIKTAERRAGDTAKLVADSTKIQKEFGWRPRHDLRSIIQSSWQWHKKT